MVTEIAPGVFTFDHRVVEGKNGILFGTHGALAIDTGNDPDEGEAMAAFLRDRGWEPNRLVLTHGHGDHVLGGAAFVGAEVFAHRAAPAVIRRHLSSWAERAGASVAEIERRLPWPTVTFAGDLDIDLGGKSARLFATPGHSEDSLCVYVPEDRVLFAADTVVTGIVPAITDGDGREMERSLQTLSEMAIDTLVSGHGPTLQGAAVVREWLRWQGGYLARTRAWVREQLARTSDPGAIAEVADYALLVGDRLPREKHGMPRRHQSVVVKILEEERRAACASCSEDRHKGR